MGAEDICPGDSAIPVSSDPIAKQDDDTNDEGLSQRPYETLTALAAKLTLSIDMSHGKNHYVRMVTSVLACEGAVLIAWQHEDIALTTKATTAGISQELLTQNGTTGTFNIPMSWPNGPLGPRYDVVFVFDRPMGNGPTTGFTSLDQKLMPSDLPKGPVSERFVPRLATTVPEQIAPYR